MSSEPEGVGQSLSQARQRTIDALCEHFANDAVAMEEFERRVEKAHRASTTAELKELLGDLPGGNLPAPADSRSSQVPLARRNVDLADPTRVKDREFVVAVLGGSARKGRWSPARKNFSLALFGGTQLDFREAVMAPGVTELQVFALWGGVEIIVPPGLNVESHGLALLGGFEHAGGAVESSDPDAPLLRITGMACMGGVEVSVRELGESSRDARRRHREERRRRHGRRRRRLSGGDE